MAIGMLRCHHRGYPRPQTGGGGADESEARLKATLGSILDEVWIVDAQGHVVLVSEAVNEHLGVTPGHWADIHAALAELEVFYPDGTPRPAEEAPLARAEGTSPHKRAGDGPPLGHRRAAVAGGDQRSIRDPDGRITGAVLVARDITERKKAEDTLSKSEERFRRIFTSNVAALAIWDAQGHLLDANDRFLELLGYTRAQFEAGQVRWDDATPLEMRQRDYEAVQELQAGREIEPYEKEFVRPDGTRVPVIIGGSILPGTPDIGVAFAIDDHRTQASGRGAAGERGAIPRSGDGQFGSAISYEPGLERDAPAP